MSARPTALIADDEPLLRDGLARMLAAAWPELDVVAQARNGREAVERFEALTPDICFLDVHMPGLSGVEAAQQIGRRAQLVFVTAFDQYAVQAFERGALDYLVKPVEVQRLAETVTRLKERLAAKSPVAVDDALLSRLLAELSRAKTPQRLDWLRVSIGPSLRMVAIDAVDFLRSDEKYTVVAWREDDGRPAEGLVRTPLKALMEGLDPARFVQVHRSAVVNLRAIHRVVRGDNETAQVHLRGRDEVLPVSRSFLHHFRQM